MAAAPPTVRRSPGWLFDWTMSIVLVLVVGGFTLERYFEGHVIFEGGRRLVQIISLMLIVWGVTCIIYARIYGPDYAEIARRDRQRYYICVKCNTETEFAAS